MGAATLTSQRDQEVLRSFARRIDPSDAGAHNNLGVLYYRKGLYEEAVEAFTRALELDPKMQVAQRNLEVAYFGTGYYDRRVAELRERLRTAPNEREARWELGRAYALLGRLPEAVAEFTELLRHHADDLGAIIQLGLAEKASGDLETAQRWFERALALDPESSVTHFYVGEVLYNRGLNDEALAALTRAIERNPDNPDAHYLMGFVLGDMGRHEEAREATKRAIRLNPTLSRAQANLTLEATATRRDGASVPPGASDRMVIAEDGQLAHFGLGLAFRQKGYYAEALREYQLALDRGEDASLVRQAMAEVHLLRKDVAAAVATYDLLLVEQPESPKLWNERGVALHQDGRYEDAAECYAHAVAADPAYAIAHNNLGVARYHAGDTAAAVEAFDRALAVAPTFVKARLNLALLLFKGKRLQVSLEAYREVLIHVPDQPVAWNGVGLVLAELRKFEDARNAFARATQSRPTYAEAHYNLSFALSNLGDFDSALRETKRALELDPYYVPQKFELAIDLQYEDPDLSIVPDLGGPRQTASSIEEFTFDATVLDSLFTELNATPTGIEVEVGKHNGVAPYAMAADYLTKGLYDRAAAEVSRALLRGADRAEGMTLLGDVFVRQGLYGEALERYRDARRASGSSANGAAPRAMMGEARALIAMGRASEAAPVAEDLLASAPDDVEALLLAASARVGAGDAEGALDALDNARRLAPDRPDVPQRIGDVNRARREWVAAMQAYYEALSLDPDLAVVRYELARLLAAAGRDREAEAELVAALDAVPTYVDAGLELAAVWRRTGRPDAALHILVELLERDLTLIPAMLALGELLFETGRRADAARAFGRLRRLEPGHPAALYYEGALLAEQRHYRDAIERWEQVIAADPDGRYARLARRDKRTAADLAQIFSPRPRGEKTAETLAMSRS
ncbi:MAG TPA: tetratricopeptide repeat protein [Gemmatimonadaceae bacterium]|nr:tetratricopeptide repeat protein [Gemmatimonadaceae bacterium]